ncbi:MAG: redoxin domain-containing protein, partial [Candidatus Micrarchaeota archaeon]|nr:redoxin domain-containing protein [Candidatus Micrarchaeota archaeon]
NCIRTIPYLNAWESKYGGSGLVIIGVHTPEFEFEKNYSNVLSAVNRFNITYPVAMDSNYSTWSAYGNRYWPADYLIDKNGNVRAATFGEGDYAQTEQEIQLLLRDAGYSPQSGLVNITSSVNFSMINTPELYLGAGEGRNPIGNKEGFSEGQNVNYSYPNVTQSNVPYLSGEWFNAPD